MSDVIITDALRDHLLAANLIEREPARPWPADYQAVNPVFVLNPRFGLSQPDMTKNVNGQPFQSATCALVLRAGPPPLPYESSLEERPVDIYLRAHKWVDAELWHRRVRESIQDQRNVFFGSLRIQWCYLNAYPQDLGADSRTYDSVQSFRIGCTTDDLVPA